VIERSLTTNFRSGVPDESSCECLLVERRANVTKKRGRPFTFSEAERQKLAELIRQHGARGAQRVSWTPISLSTLLEIAHEFGIKLKQGRRRAA
jgi:transposase